MKKSKHSPEPLALQEGFYLEHTYDNYEGLAESSKNWKYNCTFQLKPNALSGYHRILQLQTMQLGYAKGPGGVMQDSYSALDCITVAVIEKCRDKACYHRTKLHTGDIIFFDDARPYNFISNDIISYTVINIPKKRLQSIQADLSTIINHTIHDTDDRFLKMVNEIWDWGKEDSDKKTEKYRETEEKILLTLKELLETQTPTICKLTKGEESALAIRDQVYAHMDGKINIESLAKQHNVSERTLQLSCKSLFGFSPSMLLRQMKLNLVYRDLKEADVQSETVSRIAQKWGFNHMGRFSNYYTELFGENPSQTLKRPHKDENTMAGECVERQEEIM